MTIILGISAFYHDSAAALIIDGEIVAAAQEERFTRIKHDSSFPSNAVNYCLNEAKITINEINYISFYDKPFLKFDRLIKSYISLAPKGMMSFIISMIVWLHDKLYLKKNIINELRKIDKNFIPKNNIKFAEHHFSHASSAFYASPFQEALVVTLDGVGEWATTTVSIGKGNNLEIIKEIHFPHSIGLLYSAFTYYVGFKVNSGEYKLMGLAPYGTPKYTDIILKNIIDIKSDGSFRLNQKYFNYTVGLNMINKNFINLFNEPIRKPDSDKITQFHMDIAASIQNVIEYVVVKMTDSLANEFKQKNLCLSGGVALNCVANGKILKNNSFENIWIQPASGDAGGSIGVALAVWHKELNNPKKISKNDLMKGSYLGPSFENNFIKKELIKCKANFEEFTEDQMINKTAMAISNGYAVGWFQGRMEFGPRSLGARSIVGDARSEIMQKMLNLKVKYRESFRPFAPSVLREDLSEWFEANYNSPYMLLVDYVKKDKTINMTKDEENLFGIEKLNVKRSQIPAVTHVDYSARIQTVHNETNPLYYKLLSKIKDITGCSVVVNTSFNVRGEPIVCTPNDAFKCFMGTELDYLVIGNFILRKKSQDKSLIEDYKNKYDKD